MPTKKVILISGFAQAGKDTLADAIESFAPVKRLKFATALRKAAEKALKSLGVSIDVWSEEPAVKNAVRPYLIELARLARAIDRDVFARTTLQDAIYALSVNGDKTVVITDCRYDNEYSIFKEAGKQLEWEVIRIHIERTNNRPAHDEELLSVVTLDAKYPADWKVGFDDGDFEGIKRFAEMFVASTLAKDTPVI